MSPSGLQQIIPLFQRPLKTGGTVQIERKTMKIKREDIDNMSHISVIAAIALPENLEEAARSIPDEVIKQGMVMEHCLYYSQVQNQHLDLENIVITDQHRYEGLAEALSDQIMAPYSMIPNEQTPKEFEDETEAAIREYETKRDDFVRLLNGRIVPIYNYGFSKDYVVKDGLICKRRFGPLQREKRTKKAKKMQLLLDCPFKKVYPAFVDYVLQYVGNEFLNWRSGYFYNPQGYWNSFVVGGRYRNQFLVPVDCPFAVTGSYGVFEYQHDEQTYTPEGYRWVAGAKKRNIAWDALKKYREKVPVEQFHQYGAWCAQGGGPAECRLVQMDEGPIKKWGRGCFQGCETLEQFGSDVHYLCQMEPHACVDENGWINYSDDWSDSDTGASDEENWRKKVDRFIDALPDDALLLSLDCHA